MSDDDPQRKPIEADVVHEAQEVPPGPVPQLPPQRTFVPRAARRKPFFNLSTMLVLLVFVGALAFLLRRPLTETHDRVVGGSDGESSRVRMVPSGEEPPEATEPVENPEAPRHDYDVKMPPPPRPHADVDDVPVEPVRRFGPKPPPPGIAYSLVDSRSRGYGRVFRYEMKVIIPADRTRDDGLRYAKALVRNESKKRVYHALLIHFFDKPGEPEDLDPADAVAEVVWAPEGNFDLAERAAREGIRINEFRLTMKK